MSSQAVMESRRESWQASRYQNSMREACCRKGSVESDGRGRTCEEFRGGLCHFKWGFQHPLNYRSENTYVPGVGESLVIRRVSVACAKMVLDHEDSGECHEDRFGV